MTISAADLTSDLIDLTTVPLRDLRGTRRNQVTAAVDEFIATDRLDLPDEIQMQNE